MSLCYTILDLVVLESDTLLTIYKSLGMLII